MNNFAYGMNIYNPNYDYSGEYYGVIFKPPPCEFKIGILWLYGDDGYTTYFADWSDIPENYEIVEGMPILER